jgi:hypothetical protein
MDDDQANSGRSGRFKPGQSGNRKGRPRKVRSPETGSAFDELRDRKILVQMDGIDRELTVPQALLQKTYQLALAGSRMAIRTIVKKIIEHEAARAPARRPFPRMVILWPDPQDVDEAMLILGIATKTPDAVRGDGGDYLRLEPWAVASGLGRPKGRRLSDRDMKDLKGQTRDPDSITWPRSAEL